MLPKISVDTANLDGPRDQDIQLSPIPASENTGFSPSTNMTEKASHLTVPQARHAGQQASNASSNGGWDATTADETEKGRLDVTEHVKKTIIEDDKEDTGPFAFSNRQLQALVDPKELEVLRQLGGLKGLAKGLQTDILAGLSLEETTVPIRVTLAEARAVDNQLEKTGPAEPAESAFIQPVNIRRTTIGGLKTSLTARSTMKAGEDKMVSRKQIYGSNVLPARKTKNIFQLMWIALQDKVLIILSVAAVVSLALGIYETVGGPPTLDPYTGKAEPHVEWVEGVAIIIAIAIVTIVGSLNDYQKEQQFAKLNQKVSRATQMWYHANVGRKKIVRLRSLVPAGRLECPSSMSWLVMS